MPYTGQWSSLCCFLIDMLMFLGCLQDEVLCWTDIIMEQYIKIMNEDDDKDTVSQVCTCTADILKLVKYDSIQQCKYWCLL